MTCDSEVMEFRIRNIDYRIVSCKVVLQYNIPHAAMKDDEPKVMVEP